MKRAVTVKGAQAARTCAAAPAPIPHGANQRAGVNADGQKWIVLTADASDETAKDLDMQQITASIVDVDENTSHAHPDKVEYCK
jgi:hypothetical protein